jgi:hypothetical protein
MNERADELAERGYGEDVQEVCSAPQKYGSFWLKVQPHVRALAEQCQKPLPRDSAPNRSLLKRVAGANRRRTVCKRSTTFVRHLLHRSEGATIARVVSRCREAEYRVWVRAMADCYPVQAYLQRITLAKSADYPYCPGTKETLAHFACVCPQFREARTAAHNQVRKLISSLLVKCLPDRWELHEETPMANIGLRLGRVSVACMEASGRPSQNTTMAQSVSAACNLTWYLCPSRVGRLPLWSCVGRWTIPRNSSLQHTNEKCALTHLSWRRCKRI